MIIITVIAIAYGITWIQTFKRLDHHSVKADPIVVNSCVSKLTDPQDIVIWVKNGRTATHNAGTSALIFFNIVQTYKYIKRWFITIFFDNIILCKVRINIFL